MKYINLHLIIIFLIVLSILSYYHFIISINIKDNKINIQLNIKLLFKIINIKKQIYPPKKKKKKKKGNWKNIKFIKGELSNILEVTKKVKLVELYSDIKFSNKNPYITIYTSALINGIYGNIINILQFKKMHLNIVQDFSDDNICGTIKIHIKFRVSIIIKALPILLRVVIRIIKRKLSSKKGDKNDSY